MPNPKHELPKPTNDHCFKRWLEHNKPSFRDLSLILLEEGFSISSPGLHRMKDANAEWAASFMDAPDPHANRLQVTLRLLKTNAKDVEPAVFEGLGARLIGKAVQIIDKMTADGPEDLHRILDAVERVKGFAHAAKGDAIKAGAMQGVNGHGAQGGNGVLATLVPKVAVKPFGSNGSNGHGSKAG